MEESTRSNFESGPKDLSRRDWFSQVLIGLVLFLASAVLFWPACQNSFVDWDDAVYVFRQPKVLDGLSIDGLIWDFTTIVADNWHPVTMLSLQLDVQLFGSDPSGIHRTSVILHALNAAMAFWTLQMMTSARFKSAVVAGLFAVHPLRVESVAWISERKDLLSGFFFFLTIICYVNYVRRPSVGRYLPVAVCQVIGLASKSMLVTLPCLLLLLDYWPLGRIPSFARVEWRQNSKFIVEKVPLLAISFVVSFITMRSQQSSIESWPLIERISRAALSYLIYLRQTILPYGLSTFYGRQSISIVDLLVAIGVLLAITFFTIVQAKRRPYLPVGWLWYLGMLVPVIGLVQCGRQAHADRYTYLPQIGILIIVVWLGFEFAQKARWSAVASICLLFVYFTGCILLTQRQILAWHDTETLWTNAIQMDAEVRFPIQRLILLNFSIDRKEKAIRLAEELIQTTSALEADDFAPMSEIATFLSDTGEYQASIKICDKLREAFPKNVTVLVNRGKAKAAQQDWRGAAADFAEAMELSPNSEAYPFYLAHALENASEREKAEQILHRALRRFPHWPQLAAKTAYQMTLNLKTPSRFWTICLAEQANLATRGTDAEILEILAVTYANAGRLDEAISTVQKAIEIAKSNGQTRHVNDLSNRLEQFEKKRSDHF